MKKGKAQVLIIGRPNVGKSTLFNTIVGKRLAIVDSQPGVTRDLLESEVHYNEKSFLLCDSGGFMELSEDTLHKKVVEKVMEKLSEVAWCWLVVDAKEGLHPLDRVVCKIIRERRGDIFFVIANKADNPQLAQEAFSEFSELGIAPESIFAVSALHRIALDRLLQATTDKLEQLGYNLSSAKDSSTAETTPRFAIVGRPNVGKSSLINALLGREHLIVHDTPGTTRDAIYLRARYYGRHYWLVDTAGVRRKSRVSSCIEAYSITRTVSAIENSDVVILLMDAQQPATAQDLALFSVAWRRRCGVLVAINKWDLVKHLPPAEQNAIIKYVCGRLAPTWDVPVITISVKEQKRIWQVVEEAFNIYQRMHTHIKTSQLNHTLLPILRQVNLGKATTPIKVRYITQAQQTPPPTFVLFINRNAKIPTHHKRFIENQIRKHWNLRGVPIELVFRVVPRKQEV